MYIYARRYERAFTVSKRTQCFSYTTGNKPEDQNHLKNYLKKYLSTQTQAKTKELTSLGNRKYEVTTNRNMREADYDKAFNDLEAKKEFDKKREASILGFGIECAGGRMTLVSCGTTFCIFLHRFLGSCQWDKNEISSNTPIT